MGVNGRLQTTFGLWLLLLLVLFVGVGSYFWMIVPPDNTRALMRYVRPVTNSISAHELQEWAVRVLTERKADLASTDDQTVALKELPPFIHRIPTHGFTSPQVFLCRAGREFFAEDHVAIAYMGGFGSWGLRVGSETFRMRESDHCYEWAPGVYVVIRP